MRVKSLICPNKIEVIDKSDGVATVALRQNVNTIVEEDSLVNEEIHLFEYDEVEVEVRDRGNVVDSISSDFDAWFTKGIKLERLENEIKKRQRETVELIEEYKQIDINNEMKALSATSFDAIADLYTTSSELSHSKDELEESSLMLMNAIAEVYNIIAGEV